MTWGSGIDTEVDEFKEDIAKAEHYLQKLLELLG